LWFEAGRPACDGFDARLFGIALSGWSEGASIEQQYPEDREHII
jgi:hypothetical protein